MTDTSTFVETEHQPELWQRIAIFFALSSNACAHIFIFVTMPILGRQLGFSDVRTGIMMGLSAIFLMLSGPLWGVYSDRKGRRPVILIGMLAASLFPLVLAGLIQGKATFGLEASLIFVVLLVARMVQVAASGGIIPAIQAWFADTTEKADRAKGMAFMGMSYGFGSICGAALTWVLDSAHQCITLCSFGGLLFFATLSVGFTLTKTTPVNPAHVENVEHVQASAGADVRFSPLNLWPFLIATAFGMMVYSTLMQVLPLRLVDEFSLSPQAATGESGKIMMLTLVGMVGMQALFTRILSLRPIVMLQVGSLMTAVSMVCATYATSVPQLTLAVVSLGMAFGLLGPGNMALLSLTARASDQAKAAGTNVIAKGIGMTCGPILGATLHQQAPFLPFLFGAVLMVMVTCITLLVRKRAAFAI